MNKQNEGKVTLWQFAAMGTHPLACTIAGNWLAESFYVMEMVLVDPYNLHDTPEGWEQKIKTAMCRTNPKLDYDKAEATLVQNEIDRWLGLYMTYGCFPDKKLLN